MSRKITSFLTMLVALFMSVSAFAQVEELQLKSISIGVGIADFQPNTWYFFHQGRVSGGGDGLCAIGETPSMGGIMTDMGAGNNLVKRTLDDVAPESPATEKAAYLVRFIPVEKDDATDVYKIQFGTGRYLTAPAGTGNSKNITTTDNIYDAGTYNIYVIEDEDVPGHVGINVYDDRGPYQERIDNNGVNNPIVTWGSGKHDQAGARNDDGTVKEGYSNGNAVWTVVDVVWEEVDEREILVKELASVHAEYSGYLANFTPGTDPGQYDAEAVAAFEAALNAGNIDNMTPDEQDALSMDELRAMIQAIKDAYEAALATKVPMRLAEGYYRIQTAMPYTTTVEDTETMETSTVEVDRFMYSIINGSTINGKWGTPDYDCQALWYVKPLEEGRFDIQNKATDSRFNEVIRSTAVTMSTTSTAEMVVTPVITKDGVTIVNINVYPQNGDDGLYLHQNRHGASGGVGTGTGESLVGWYSTYNFTEDYPQASEWKFVPVDEAEALQIIADYEPVKNRDEMLARYDSIMSEAKANLDIAKDMVSEKLITQNSQFSSPWTEASEGSLNNLLDGDTNTFWHSAWSGGNVDAHVHYLQVALNEAIDKEIYLAFSRRTSDGTPVANDHVTQWGIFGSNNPEAADEEWIELANIETPYSSSVINVTTDPFSTQGNQYLRFYADATSTSRGYWHVGEFQLYTVPESNPNAQMNFMGDLATNLETLIEDLDAKDRDDIGIDDYNALKAAYDAFMTKFVDPTELRNTLKDLAGTADVVVVGDQPGFWSADNGAGAFKTLYEEAKAYDASGDYTPEKSQSYVEQLTAQSKDIFTSAIPVQTGKWYRIRFATEDEFEQYEWDKSAGNGTASGSIPELFGKYISTGFFFEEGGNQFIEPIESDEVGLGSNLYFIANDDLDSEDATLFRFVAVGDSAYMLQNKATNLFIRAAGTSGAVTLSAHPTLFNVRAIGYGENVISAKNITGDYQSNLHAQVSHNVLVTWDVDYPGSRSGLYIEEAGDVAADFDGTEFNVPVVEGAVNAFCFPVEISVKKVDNAPVMWTVNKLEGTKVTLAKIDKAVAGRPFILVYGKTQDYEAELADPEMVVLKHGYEIGAVEPDTTGLLRGTYYGETIGSGKIVAEANTLALSKKSSTAVGVNSAYIVPTEAYTDLDVTLEVFFSNEGDGIETALANVSRSGAVYTIDGRLVSKKATLDDLTRFGKGLYILNGTKVLVK